MQTPWHLQRAVQASLDPLQRGSALPAAAWGRERCSMPDLTTSLLCTPAAAFGRAVWLEQQSSESACSTDQNHFGSDQVLMEHAGS